MKPLSIKRIFPHTAAARYNFAVWKAHHKNTLCMVGREVAQPAKTGEPDTGTLKLFELTRNGSITREKTIWRPVYDGISLEDPRALITKNNTLLIGLTAVLRGRTGNPIPFPALVRIGSLTTWKDQLPPYLIIESFGPGKNLTPVTADHFLFRPESENYNHALLVFSLRSQIPTKFDEIHFPPNLPWAKWRMGTSMPPVWISKSEALFIVHGISQQKINGKIYYIYSIGRGKLTRNKNDYEAIIAQEPLLTPWDFQKPNGDPLVGELHPESRRVVYSCGGVVHEKGEKTLSLYVNVGDRTTFEVTYRLRDLIKGLF